MTLAIARVGIGLALTALNSGIGWSQQVGAPPSASTAGAISGTWTGGTVYVTYYNRVRQQGEYKILDIIFEIRQSANGHEARVVEGRNRKTGEIGHSRWLPAVPNAFGTYDWTSLDGKVHFNNLYHRDGILHATWRYDATNDVQTVAWRRS